MSKCSGSYRLHTRRHKGSPSHDEHVYGRQLEAFWFHQCAAGAWRAVQRTNWTESFHQTICLPNREVIDGSPDCVVSAHTPRDSHSLGHAIKQAQVSSLGRNRGVWESLQVVLRQLQVKVECKPLWGKSTDLNNDIYPDVKTILFLWPPAA